MVFSFSKADVDFSSGYIPGFNIRTDLAIEAHEVVTEKEELPGVSVEEEGDEEINISRVSITTEEAAKRMGKEMGSYLTLEIPGLRNKDTALQEKVIKVFYKELQKMLALNGDKNVMVIGLGNWNVTPDALGPRVVKELFITRHIMQMKPEILGEGYRSVCALSPGVLGITGIETSEIIRGVVEQIKPDMIVAIDALAASRLERLNTTIQVADTGVIPGSGVKNRRLGINKETMGIPVFGIGVPTVVDAVTIAGDTMQKMADNLKTESPQGNVFYNSVKKMNWREKKDVISDVMEPYSGDLIVTPKEIDTLVEDISLVVAASLDAAFHPQIAQAENGE